MTLNEVNKCKKFALNLFLFREFFLVVIISVPFENALNVTDMVFQNSEGFSFQFKEIKF